ncbi:MAG: ATP synthase F1 subunit gamma [Pseudomonadota bacterium]
MNNLKDLRVRIKSVKSTQKITSAMKMVATAKLRKAQERLENGRVYATKFEHSLHHALHNSADIDPLPLLKTGNKEGGIFILAIATDRGLCGGYNTSIMREIKAFTHALSQTDNRAITIAAIGRKIKSTLGRECDAGRIDARLFEFQTAVSAEHTTMDFKQVSGIAEEIMALLESGEIGSVHIITGRLKSIISQPIEARQLVPLIDETVAGTEAEAPYTIFEPKPEILTKLMLMHNFIVQMNTLFLENTACEHAARMTAMDNASRNARDMIQKLQLRYNQGRQAQITNELIEIISGSNAV